MSRQAENKCNKINFLHVLRNIKMCVTLYRVRSLGVQSLKATHAYNRRLHNGVEDIDVRSSPG